MSPFSAVDTAAITAEQDAVSRCHNFGSSVPFGLLQSNSLTILCSIRSQQGVDVADTVNAVDRCCVNVERAERELIPSPPASPVAQFQVSTQGFALVFPM